MSYSDIPTSQHSFSIMVKTSYKLYSQLVGSLSVVGSKPSILTNFVPFHLENWPWIWIWYHEFTKTYLIKQVKFSYMKYYFTTTNWRTNIFVGSQYYFAVKFRSDFMFTLEFLFTQNNIQIWIWRSGFLFCDNMNCIKLNIDFLVKRKIDQSSKAT